MQTQPETSAILERIFSIFETGTVRDVRRANRELEKELRDAAVTLHGRDEKTRADYLAAVQAFVLKTVQHQNERVRDAAVWVGVWLNDWLRERAKGKTMQARARAAYRDYVRAIELLLDYYDAVDPVNEEAEFIDEMRPSPQKSLEMLLDRVTHGGYEFEITHVAPPDILARREKLETEIARLLDRTGSHFCFHDVLEQIYHEEGPEDLQMIIDMFEGGGAGGDLPAVVDVVHDAWNYFPHESLDGWCPAEKC